MLNQHDVAEFWAITNQLKVMKDRLELVRRRIINSALAGQERVHPGSTITTQTKDYNVQIQIKKGRTPSIDRGALEELIYEKGLWEECTRPQLDDDLVEQAFIEGKITDEDLRSIREETTPQMAVKVQRAIAGGEEFVPTNNEGIC